MGFSPFSEHTILLPASSAHHPSAANSAPRADSPPSLFHLLQVESVTLVSVCLFTSIQPLGCGLCPSPPTDNRRLWCRGHVVFILNPQNLVQYLACSSAIRWWLTDDGVSLTMCFLIAGTKSDSSH